MTAARIAREGFIAGLIGAALIAVWFFIIDVIAGRPFYTPALLGSTFFWGLRDPTIVEITFPSVIAYSMVHMIVFLVVGMVVSGVATAVEKAPSTLFLAVILFTIFEFGFYIIMLAIARPVLGELAWWNVLLGNLVAALGMGYYIWRVHPVLKANLAAQPLGSTATSH